MTKKIRVKRSDLLNQSGHELVSLIRKLQEVDQSQKQKSLDNYLSTAHLGQLAFHKAQKRIRLVFSGNRWGKSTAGVVEMHWTLSGRHPFRKAAIPKKGLIIATDFENHVKNVIEPKMTQWAPPGMITKVDRNQQGAARRFYYSCGSICDVVSQDQDTDVFESADYDIAWADEPLPRHIFNAVWRGLTDRGGYFYFTGTPITEPWLYQEFKKAQEGDELRWAVFGNTIENAQNIGEGDAELGKKRVEEFAAMLDPEERLARLEGQFLQMQGLVFKNWKRETHLIAPFSWPADWQIIESIDPHPRKPWGYAAIGLTPNKRKILLYSELIEGVIDEVAQGIIAARESLDIEHGRKPKIIRTLIDNYASAPLMSRSNTDPTARRKSIREELEDLIGARYGGVPVTVAPKDVKQKIDIMKRWLHKPDDGDPEFFVFDTAENERFVWEIENYIWDAKRGMLRNGLKDQPRKIDDDLIDCVMQVALTLKDSGEVPESFKSIKNTASYTGRYRSGGLNGRRV
jgi:hypothetical protein